MSWTRWLQPTFVACLLISSLVGAEAFQAAGKKNAIVAPVVDVAASAERSVVAFGYGGKLGPKDEGFVPGFESYKLRFGPGDWAGARIIITSAWGDQAETNYWNWPDGPNVKATDALSDKNGYYFIYSLATAHTSNWVAANFRITLRDGRHAVADALIPYGGNLEISKETLAVLGFDGKVGPKDEGYVPEFESYKLRFGPGDWAGTKIVLSSNWGEGTDGADLWGWKGGSEAKSSEVRRDPKGYYFIHSLRKDGHSRWIASLFRISTKNGRAGIAQALYSYSGALSPPKPTGQPADYPVAAAPMAKKRPKPSARILAEARPTIADLNYIRSVSEVEDPAARTELYLMNKPIDDEDLVHFRGLKQLRKLWLNGTRVGDAGLEEIAGLTNLQVLGLTDTSTTDAALEVICNLSGLTELHLDGTLVTDSGMRSLKRLKNLETLTLGKTDVGDAGIAALKDLPALRVLSLAKDSNYVTAPMTQVGLVELKKFPKLTDLFLYGVKFGDEGLKALQGKSGITKLDLRLTDVSDTTVGQLAGIPSLEQLHLEQTRVTDAGLAQLKTLPKLKSLHLGYTDIGDAGLAGVSGLEHLEVLAITKGKVTDAGVAHLKGMTGLTSLMLPDNQITGAGVANLKGLTKLKELNLYYNKLDNASLAVIKSLPKLEPLYVSGDQITDEGLVHLMGMPNLRYLSISWTKATQAGIDDLKKSLPDLRVSFGDY